MSDGLAADLDHVLAHTEELWADARGARFFITGGTGFVGTWLAESLAWANKRLSLGLTAVLLTRDPTRFRARCPHLAADPAIALHRGDATDFDCPPGTFPFVVHAATERNHPPTEEAPVSTFDRDICGARRVLELARQRGTARLLFTSSGAAYGKQPPELTHIPEDYSGAPLTSDPDSAYGHGKRVSEFLCCSYSRVYGFATTIARLFTFVGPHLPLDAQYAVGNFIGDVLLGEPIRITGDGTACRSYLYAADLAIWLWTILFRGETAFPYNVGSPEGITIAELAQHVAATTSSRSQIQIALAPVPGSVTERYVPSTNRAREELGLRQWIPLDEAIRRTYDWHARMRAAEGACA